MISVAHAKLVQGIGFVDEEMCVSLIEAVAIAGITYSVPDEYHRRRAESILKRLGSEEAVERGESDWLVADENPEPQEGGEGRPRRVGAAEGGNSLV